MKFHNPEGLVNPSRGKKNEKRFPARVQKKAKKALKRPILIFFENGQK
jgi:diacylglycerol kinase family enzyme